MKPSFIFRLREWAADRFDSVQYPNVRPLNRASRVGARVQFVHPMPVGQRISMVMLCAGAAAIAIPLLIAVCAIVWAFVSSM
ncbi:hypothetical protein KTE60_11615 [Burkholderia multivorans]|uniref:hypothetical protein n=1 Tax=Burkholderia multivorans TaxID=87883 RepID=UPI001C245170|nr:hypothetical protein [Burkholderia multivorans]MBU9629932.1 hypothetical protein [Burkholderia multivorans]HEF4743300.1 hypothetical protein [Burkholderia multivorans]